MTESERVGEAYAWIEQGSSIHLKAASPEGDPLELTAGEARALAQALLSLADELDSLDSVVAAMAGERPELELLAQQLAAIPAAPQALATARREIEMGNGEQLFKALLRHAEAADTERSRAATMTILERIIDASPGVGAYLMGRLHRVCRFEHDVYDAIELWMEALRSPEAADFLDKLAGELGRGGRSSCQGWAEKIRSKAR